ncbi:hypothetical protein C5F84_08970, partial [Pseudomonas aeruginosa]
PSGTCGCTISLALDAVGGRSPFHCPTRLTQRVIGHSSSLGAPYPPVWGTRYPGIHELNSSVIFPGSGFSHESFRQ